MPRADLLALTLDDLAALTNRGTVKRARREVETSECTAELTEGADGSVTAKWSDGVECRLPAGVVLRDTHCDCAEPAPCAHVPLAVWAFRRLEPDRSAGILATAAQAPPAPVALLDDLDAAALAFTEYGVSGAPRTWADRLTRLENA